MQDAYKMNKCFRETVCNLEDVQIKAMYVAKDAIHDFAIKTDHYIDFPDTRESLADRLKCMENVASKARYAMGNSHRHKHAKSGRPHWNTRTPSRKKRSSCSQNATLTGATRLLTTGNAI